MQGNHEAAAVAFINSSAHDSGGECGVPTWTRYPGPVEPGDVRDYWTLTHGSALLVMLNSELEIGPGSDQYDFLSSTLGAINRNVTPWSIVMFHRVSGASSTSELGPLLRHP
jgi:hypothetical protein